MRVYLIVLIGSLVLAGNAGAGSLAAEMHREIDSPSAGIRAGTSRLRITIWRPAAAGSKVEALVIGPPGKPVFQAGEAAGPDSAWPDEARHPLVLMSHGFGGTTNAEIFAKGVKGAKLEILPKVRHYDFLSPCTDFGRQVAGDYCASAVDRVAMHDQGARKALAFFGDALNVRDALDARGIASQ